VAPVKEPARGGLRLATLWGIEIRLDPSVAIIFALIVYSLGAALLTQWHPDWTAPTRWLTALGAGLAFFASLLAHELSHSVVARLHGIQVPRITLFLFGGMAEIEREADAPADEFRIAIAGPLMSLALAVGFAALAGLFISPDAYEALVEDPAAGIAQLGPLATASLWLASVNAMLALFNLVPGFPLDGGRVLRALVWRATGNQLLATRFAATGGRWFGWLIMGLGLYELLVLQSLGGLWLLLIGWFLSHLATASYSQALTQRLLAPLKVRDLMRTRFESVPASLAAGDFVNDYLLRSSQQLWPVLDGERAAGLVSVEEIKGLPEAQRAQRRLGELMRSLDEVPSLRENDTALDASRLLDRLGDQPVPVRRGDQVVGLLRGSDLLRWIMLHSPPQQRD